MTITMRKAISACRAFCEICEPQLAPTKFTLIWLCGMPSSFDSVDWTCCPCA